MKKCLSVIFLFFVVFVLVVACGSDDDDATVENSCMVSVTKTLSMCIQSSTVTEESCSGIYSTGACSTTAANYLGSCAATDGDGLSYTMYSYSDTAGDEVTAETDCVNIYGGTWTAAN